MIHGVIVWDDPEPFSPSSHETHHKVYIGKSSERSRFLYGVLRS